MRRALAEPFRDLWRDTGLLKIVVAVALVWAGLAVLQSLVAVITSPLFGHWRFVDDWWWVISWYVAPLVQSIIVFVAVVIVAALIYRVVRRRRHAAGPAEQ